MESLEWHERLISRMIKNNADSTIRDYVRITETFNSKKYMEQAIKWAEKEIMQLKNNPIKEHHDQNVR